jgi:hypothetical protein
MDYGDKGLEPSCRSDCAVRNLRNQRFRMAERYCYRRFHLGEGLIDFTDASTNTSTNASTNTSSNTSANASTNTSTNTSTNASADNGTNNTDDATYNKCANHPDNATYNNANTGAILRRDTDW